MSSVPPSRIRRLTSAMATQDLDAMVVFKPQNSFYMSGFNPIIYSHPVVAVLCRDGESALLVHALRDDHARAASFVDDIRLYGAWSSKVTMGPSWKSALATILEEKGVAKGRIGLDMDFLSVARFRELEEVLPDARLADASEAIMQCRYVKDPDEIENARAAARMADIGMDAAIAELRRGGNEREIASAAMAAMNRAWTDDHPDKEVADFGNLEHGVQNGLFAWVLSGERMFLNSDNPTVRVPRRGETASLFIWSVLDGIHIENERTVMIGDVAPEKKQALEAILDIRAEVFARIRPGTPISDLFDCSKAGLEARGYGKYIPGRIGHSMGLGAHELPSIDAATQVPLQPGMLLAIEPNIRIPGEVATQISDTVLVTETGMEQLTRSEGGLLRV
ncbi:Xaa-Pro peptidase family protein [Psychromarinibacter sp. C21-152]|uniref:Xaa-Pro peptidase family protein n=1 Tax=Psychromarinibacter sediminicola TaxID=3033385 RepID=A0AAE3NWH1_9RHOB|nr:Xaa-Pro peptidase family protein [Psychromarinibacter sediminicola]MDF0603531.1 Xaa-Pro peptidase family protein [Psychromarinibacter sediminicola]